MERSIPKSNNWKFKNKIKILEKGMSNLLWDKNDLKI